MYVKLIINLKYKFIVFQIDRYCTVAPEFFCSLLGVPKFKFGLKDFMGLKKGYKFLCK